ncbi:non-ribosomal peptide synthetase [Marinibacterium sp. SX1]|uniref:non-ribosomal peptide synthetase n=1 Tax=Marinibacterium sp. SX1 TaxID=3388424 RepID=UPI003D16C499
MHDDLSDLLDDWPDDAAPALPALDPDAPFAMTDMQRAYLAGRSPERALGGIACQFYYELRCDGLDIAGYTAAWNRVAARHGMLRAEPVDATHLCLRPGPLQLDPPWHDLRGDDPATAEAALEAIRHRLSRAPAAPGTWPLFDLEYSLHPGGRVHVHLRFDLLIADQQSILILLRESAALLADPTLDLPPPELSFAQYLALARSARPPSEAARAYWADKARTLADAPALPYAQTPQDAGLPRFERLRAHLSPDRWARLRGLAADLGVTPTGLLLESFGQVLRRWSGARQFTVNMTLFDRAPLHPGIGGVVGDFTTNMLFQADIPPDLPRAETAARLQAALWRDLGHGGISGIEVAAMAGRARGVIEPMMMPVVFTSTLTRGDAELIAAAAGQPGRQELALSQTPQVVLDNQVMEWDGALRVNWDVAVNVLPAPVARAMFDAYLDDLVALADDPARMDRPAPRHDPGPQDIRPILHPPGPDGLASLWLAALHENGTRPAILAGGQKISHAALAEQAAWIAQGLAERGVQPGDRVALLLPKSPVQIAAALAAAATGVVFVPVDTAQPPARQAAILDDLAPRLVLALDGATLPEGHAAWVIARPGRADPALLHAAPPPAPDALAYVIYTSGSTGRPKGVMISHRAAMTTIRDINHRFGIGPADRVLALSELHFDLSIHDIFGVLGAGGALVLPDPGQARDPGQWAALCAEHGVTLWNSVPGLFDLLCDWLDANDRPGPDALRCILLSGDWIALSLPGRAARIWPGAALHSLGGATEAAIWSITHPVGIPDPEWASVPYGRALGGQQVFVLDEALEIAPPGRPGEIFIAGAGLAEGYANDPEKTAAAFFDHPRSGLRLYRTGDLGVGDAQGVITFLGRADDQVKINGYRLELGEVTQALGTLDGVAEALVLAQDSGRGNKALAAFVRGDPPPEGPEGWRRALAGRLPGYMVPDRWHVIDRFPLTPNGKVDRKALRARAVPPREPAEHKDMPGHAARVCAMVAEVLKCDRVTPEDNLVALGAGSLELIALATRIEALTGRRPQLTELARSVDLSDLIALVAGLMPGEAAPTAAPLLPGEARLRDWLARNRAIADPVERRLFKSRRRGQPQQDGVALGGPAGAALAAPPRASQRRFAPEPTPLDTIGGLLAPLRDGAGGTGSAGGLYPVAIHLHPLADRVAGLDPGAYCHDRAGHRLIPGPGQALHELAPLSAGNAGWIGEAHFLLSFVLDLDAIAPLYEGASLAFGLIETGAICQRLEETAPTLGLGLCQIGDMPAPRLNDLLGLTGAQVCLHNMVGGLSAVTAPADTEEGTL